MKSHASGGMDLFDPRREPMLEAGHARRCRTRLHDPERSEAEALLRDGSWLWCEVIGQRKDRQGRWYVGIRYYASPSIGESGGWYVLNRRYIRRPDGLGGGHLVGQLGSAAIAS